MGCPQKRLSQRVKAEVDIFRVNTEHHKIFLSQILHRPVTKKEAINDLIERYRKIMRGVSCYSPHNSCGEPKETNDDKHLTPYDNENRTFFPYGWIDLTCKHAENFEEVFEKVMSDHLVRHKWYQHITYRNEAEQHFRQSFGLSARQMYCMLCPDKNPCKYDLANDLKRSLENPETIYLAKGIERILIENQLHKS